MLVCSHYASCRYAAAGPCSLRTSRSARSTSPRRAAPCVISLLFSASVALALAEIALRLYLLLPGFLLSVGGRRRSASLQRGISTSFFRGECSAIEEGKKKEKERIVQRLYGCAPGMPRAASSHLIPARNSIMIRRIRWNPSRLKRSRRLSRHRFSSVPHLSFCLLRTRR